MAVGDAHLQIGIVEAHMRLLKNQLSMMEDEFPEASIDDLVEPCVAAKVRRQTFDGYSQLQRWFSERLDAWQDPDGREQPQYGHLVPPSPDSDVVPAPPNPESQFPPHPV